MNVACPECHTVYRLDPVRIPEAGARTRCRECGTAILLSADAAAPGGFTASRWLVITPPPGPPQSSEAPPRNGAHGAPRFGAKDPQTRARRLARASVSDIKLYNRDRWERSRQAGTLRRDFRDDILKSWDEYVDQVGETMARQSPYFRDALNEILAEGERVF